MPPADQPARASPAGENSPWETQLLQRAAASTEELQQRRREIHSGLQRSFYAVLGASVMVGLLAVAAAS